MVLQGPALKSHMKSKKHIERSPQATSTTKFFVPAMKENIEPNPLGLSKEKTQVAAQSCRQVSIDGMVTREHVIQAEIRWALKVVECKLSMRSCDGINELFKVMFSDSEVAKQFLLSRTKCTYVINHGLAPHFKSVLIDDIQKSPFYTISFDESLNKKLKRGQMDILIRYWNDESKYSETRYLDSQFLGGANAQQILESFNNGIKSMDARRNIQISSDGPNVNLKFLELVNEGRCTAELPTLLNIGTCGLHTVHGSLKAGVKSTDWSTGKILKSLWKLLDESPARREKYESITETNVYPLPYCGHRWCENEDSANRAELIWVGYVKFIKHLNSLPKSRQPQCKSYAILLETIDDPLQQTKFKFVEFIASKMNVFLKGFQTDQPMVPFLCEILKNLLSSLLRMFVLNSTIEKADTVLKMLKIDTSDRNIYKPLESIELGMASKLLVSKYKKSPHFKDSNLRNFYKGVRIFISSVTSHMMEKCPLKHLIVRCASCLNPNIMSVTSNNDISKMKLNKMLEKLVAVNQITAKQGDEAKEQFCIFVEDVVAKHREEFSSFEMFTQRLDVFLMRYLSEKKFESLSMVCILIFCLSHGQSSIERGFSINKEFISDNQSESSLISLRMVHDHLKSKNVTSKDVVISGDMIKSVRSARTRYDQARIDDSTKKNESAANLKRKIISNELEEVNKKKLRLKESVEELVKDSDKLAFEAADKSDFKILERSNDLRLVATGKKKEIQELEEMSKSLILRRDSIV